MSLRNNIVQSSTGVGLALIITILSFALGQVFEMNLVLLALVIGVIVGNVISIPKSFEKGIKFCSNRFLEFSIVLMAFGINYAHFLDIGWQAITAIVVSMTILLASTIVLAKKFKCPGSTGWLVGFGTAICGSSAIAALAPSVAKEKSDIGIALAVVNLFGLIGMIAMPIVTKGYLSEIQNSVLLGGTLHSVGNVAGAGFSMSNAIGEMAITVKMARVALLTPALLLFTLFLSPEKESSSGRKINLPWYLILFVLISIVVSIIPLNETTGSYIKQASNWLLAVAMAAIGLNVSFKKLLSAGKKGMVFGAVLFAIQIALISGAMYLLNI